MAVTSTEHHLVRVSEAGVDGLKSLLYGLIDGGTDRILLDLGEVSALGSTGMRAIVAATRAMGHGGRIGLARPQPAVARALALTGLTHLIEVHDSTRLDGGAPAVA